MAAREAGCEAGCEDDPKAFERIIFAKIVPSKAGKPAAKPRARHQGGDPQTRLIPNHGNKEEVADIARIVSSLRHKSRERRGIG